MNAVPSSAGPGRDHNDDAAGAPGSGLPDPQSATSNGSHSDESELPPGLRIPGYILTHRVADGGSGTVFRALRDGGGSDLALAIKLLRVRLGQCGSASAQRALRELQILESLRLPTTPRLLDYGHTGGHLFLVTEFIEGTPPDRYASEQALSRRDRAALLAEIADAVHSLHEHGVIHRDLKPSNILITPSGQPVILDLGLAALQQDSHLETLSTEGQPIGTPAYMAPEQARGERSRISTRTDVFALGAIGYHLLTGHTPYDTHTTIHEAIRRVGQDPPRAPRDLDPSVPKRLAAVLARACNPDPLKRYHSAATLADDLRRWLAGEPVSATPPTPWSRLLRRIARHPVLTTGAACALLIATAIGASSASVWWLNSRPSELRFDHDNHRWVRLTALNGRVLHSWESAQGGGISGAEFIDRPPALGGGRLVMITGQPSDLPLVENRCLPRVALYDMRHPTSALWFTGSSPPDLNMPHLEGFIAPQRYSLHRAIACDIFPGSPGKEIIAVLGHDPWAPTCLRVYDLAGEVLFEAWHNGYLERPCWLPGPGLLVLAGNNSEVLWRGRGEAEADEAFPIVVFALRPKMGERHGWITTPSKPGDLAPEWYKCLLPARAPEAFNGGGFSITPGIDLDPSWYATLVLPSMHFTLDSKGQVASRQLNSHLMQRSAVLASDVPNPTTFEIGDLPPIEPGMEESCRPPNGPMR